MADQNDKVREAWNTNARFWDSRMAEGNDWFNVLIWPRVETLLQMRRIRSISASIRLKIAVFAPMPSANDRMATAVNTGLRRIPRTA